MKALFEKVKLNEKVELRNRFVMAPMTTYSANEDDTVSDEEIAYYKERASGAGMIITACAYVAANGKAFPGQIAAHEDHYIPSLQKIAQAIQQGGAKAVLQIHHGGRQSLQHLVPNGDVVSASAAITIEKNEARPLTLDETKQIIKAYGEATRRAIQAGFDGVEIHGANTYLIQQFYSAFTNKRIDEYGGTIDKRMRFPLEIVEEVLKVKNTYADESFIVGYRFSPEEPEEDGITMDHTIMLVDELAKTELTYLHISLGDFRSETHRFEKGQQNRISAIQNLLDGRKPLIGVGSIYTVEEAEHALQLGADLVALGRALLIEPHWVEKVEKGEQVHTAYNENIDTVLPSPLLKRLQSRPGWVPGF
ncbi:NADH-dependent flavin oxidoreductase [Solibacillus sp. A46]|uniref:NADH-dependent flavin oxidoreductase n=1 Tax=Solibacillus faecavium TaxID=2762221 RepID=A0ABR8Y3I3_9BACL|nr:NADH-dependent flavin oxidoreductase [Solibacillus faecavium]MBD8038777.1 NADH-dependent flavin oxidoreductase [Solibacillus faecavium]